MRTKLLLSVILMCAMIIPAHAYTVTANVPAQTDYCYIVGNFNGWNPSATPMTKVSDGLFTVEIDVAAIASQENDTLDFKLCAGPDWGYQQTDPGDNLKYKLAEHPTTLDVTINAFQAYYQPVNLDIEVWVPMDVVECYIVGNFNNWKAPYEATKMKFEGTESEGNIYSITLNDVDPATLEIKFCAGPSWDFEQTVSDNFKYSESDPIGTFVVNSFKAVFDPALTGNITIIATVPDGTAQVWIQGSFPGDSWSWDNPKEMTKNEDGTFSYTTGLVMNLEYRLYNAPDWNHPEVGEADPTKDLDNRQVSFDPDNSTINISVWGWKVTVNGVNNPQADYFTIRTADNHVVIDGALNKVSIFDINGRTIENGVANGIYTSKVLTTGLYVVLVDGYARKVLVK